MCSIERRVFKDLAKFTGKTPVPESTFFKIETLPQAISSEFCEIFKKTFFYRTPRRLLLKQITPVYLFHLLLLLILLLLLLLLLILLLLLLLLLLLSSSFFDKE